MSSLVYSAVFSEISPTGAGSSVALQTGRMTYFLVLLFTHSTHLIICALATSFVGFNCFSTTMCFVFVETGKKSSKVKCFITGQTAGELQKDQEGGGTLFR